MKSNYIILGLLLGFVFIVLACDKDDTPESACEEKTYYIDADGDGFGNLLNAQTSCSPIAGYVLNSDDCDDDDASKRPDVGEVEGDGIDNDCNGQVDEEDPATFQIEIVNPGLDTAFISWSKYSFSSDRETQYKVLLNDEEIISGLSRDHFLAKNLTQGTDYSLEVIAYDISGEIAKFASFSTDSGSGGTVLIGMETFLDQTDNYYTRSFQYNEIGQVTTQTDYRTTGPGTIGFISKVDFNYDEIGRESSVIRHGFITRIGEVFSNTKYLNYGYIEETGDIGAVVYGNQSGDSSYDDYYRLSYSHGSESPDEFNAIYQPYPTDAYSWWEGETLKDAENRLLSIIGENPLTSSNKEQYFEYIGNNLVRVEDALAGYVFEIEYDSQPNFHTIPNHFFDIQYTTVPSSSGRFDLTFLGLFAPPDGLRSQLFEATLLFQHENTNNPIEYRLNGETQIFLDYEYNSLGYPSKITINGDPNNYVELYYGSK